ncbi:hypothetical protein D3C78_1089790 [compost metagenome]
MALPLAFATSRRPAGSVTARDHPGGAELGIDIVQVEVRSADLHRQLEGGVGQQALRQLHRQVIHMQFGADKARMAAPGGLADDVAVFSQGRLGQFDDPAQIEKRQPQRVAVEHALVMIEQAAVVPVLRIKAINCSAQRDDLGNVQHAAQQYETLSVQGPQTAGGQ